MLSVKEQVFAANSELPVRQQQQLVHRPGPHCIDAQAEDATLDGAGVAEVGAVEPNVLLAQSNREMDRQVLPVEYPNDGRIGRYQIFGCHGSSGSGRCVIVL